LLITLSGFINRRAGFFVKKKKRKKEKKGEKGRKGKGWKVGPA
jgi:hypothetical protein